MTENTNDAAEASGIDEDEIVLRAKRGDTKYGSLVEGSSLE